ncbi:hypothetical protein TRL7639_01915 [Falsiruegeria litorea R37]|uniref:DUF3616 domain-containing protein n=1 Tax=Falsiruegeria litorea R37 TaxID=1200284 RepID=A0A1Y5SEP7_9RHOB|nr:DUF3616 domain-containing protein [Falsiruegeria litorea]SLN38294.1 hypothetical protein TRL7639_01915 [Falsiruegeria litorea R37]
MRLGSFSLVFALTLPSFGLSDSGQSLDVRGQFDEYAKDDPKPFAAQNLSAAHCRPEGLCYTASDEVRFIQSFRVDGEEIETGGRLYLWDTPQGRDADELDVEGIASVNGHLIAVGSHSVSRQKCKVREHNEQIYIGSPHGVGTQTPLTAQPISLRPAFAKFDVLRGAFHQPLQQNGLNIEGVAAIGDQVFFGFRAPYPDGAAGVLILQIGFEALLAQDWDAAELHRVALSSPHGGRGIRGMEQWGDSLLLLVGDAGAKAPRKKKQEKKCGGDSPHLTDDYAIHRWTPGSDAADLVSRIEPKKRKWKAEGLMRDPTRSDGSVLVFFDGPDNGGPRRFTFPALAQ